MASKRVPKNPSILDPILKLFLSILEAPGLDFEGSGDDFSRLSHVFWHVASKMYLQYSLQNPSSDLSHVGRADTLKEVRIC